MKCKHGPFLLFYLAFLFVGIFLFKDYGLSWDEPLSRSNIGLINFDYIAHGNIDPLLNSTEKFHGPVFEILLVSVEKLFHQTDSRTIYLTRHLLTFLSFALGVFFFYWVGFRFFKETRIALIGCLFLVISPRIFAESFYNSKDIPILSLFILNMYSMLLFLEKRNVGSMLFHSLTTAIAIDIRITAVILPLLTLGLMLKNGFPKFVQKSLLYFLSVALLVTFFWPFLWRNPLINFFSAFSGMSHYHWEGTVLYQGKYLSSALLPWHFIPLWLGITTPLLYSGLFLMGLVMILIKLFRKGPFQSQEVEFYLMNLSLFFIPLASVIVLHSVLYDSWRHLYFVYPAFLLIALVGLQTLLSTSFHKGVRQTVYGGIGISLLFTGYEMGSLHPYQNVYFNSLAGKNMSTIRKQFELDYWGLSYRNVIENVLKFDPSKNIKIYADNYPGITNSFLVPPKERKRIVYVDSLNKADYFITNFRWRPESFPFGKEVYSVKVDGTPLASAFKLSLHHISD